MIVFRREPIISVLYPAVSVFTLSKYEGTLKYEDLLVDYYYT